MTNGYVPFAQARREQSALLELAVPRVVEQVRALAAAGRLAGPGPVFVGIGASFAAAGAPVWALRSRGIHSWRLGAAACRSLERMLPELVAAAPGAWIR